MCIWFSDSGSSSLITMTSFNFSARQLNDELITTMKSCCLSASFSLISRLLVGMCGIFPWSKRYPDCPPTWLSWEQMSHDLKWDKLWMREDWLSGGRQSPSQFIWHGYLGNKTVRQEAERRCKLLFVWITAKEAACTSGISRVGY